VETAFGWSVLPAKLIRSVNAAPPRGANAASGAGAARLAIELRDGSHLVGKSLDDILDFHTPAMGDLKLAWTGIRSIQDVRSLYVGMNETLEMGRLAAANGDVYDVQFAARSVRLETSFGKTELPVKLIRSVSVSAIGSSGQAGGAASNMDIDPGKGKPSKQSGPTAAGQVEGFLNKDAVQAAMPGQI
jgi:hypothetical protein